MNEDAIALRLGRLVIASARLELHVKNLAEFLGEPNVRGLSQLGRFKAIRKRILGRSDNDEIRAWAIEANELLKSRGELVHGGFLGRVEHHKMPAYISFKAGEVVDIDLTRLDGLVEAATRLSGQGREFAERIFGEFVRSFGGDSPRDE